MGASNFEAIVITLTIYDHSVERVKVAMLRGCATRIGVHLGMCVCVSVCLSCVPMSCTDVLEIHVT